MNNYDGAGSLISHNLHFYRIESLFFNLTVTMSLCERAF